MLLYTSSFFFSSVYMCTYTYIYTYIYKQIINQHIIYSCIWFYGQTITYEKCIPLHRILVIPVSDRYIRVYVYYIHVHPCINMYIYIWVHECLCLWMSCDAGASDSCGEENRWHSSFALFLSLVLFVSLGRWWLALNSQRHDRCSISSNGVVVIVKHCTTDIIFKKKKIQQSNELINKSVALNSFTIVQ